jgi:hypothetical protein
MPRIPDATAIWIKNDRGRSAIQKAATSTTEPKRNVLVVSHRIFSEPTIRVVNAVKNMETSIAVAMIRMGSVMLSPLSDKIPCNRGATMIIPSAIRPSFIRKRMKFGVQPLL